MGSDELLDAARALGLTLSPEDARVYEGHVRAKLEQLDEFMRTPFEEQRPPLLAADRKPGRRPAAAEDPLNAWLWKCEIKASATGILAGKTVSYKDHVAVAGMPLTLGSAALTGFVPDFDATIVTRALAAGATVVGKNAMTGPFTGGPIDIEDGRPRPLNPHDHEHITGGSSSGSGAAVAAGQVDIAFGGDQAGSIRLPAAFCGIYGLKPTFGLVSHFGVAFGSDQAVDHTGPMARRAEDVAAALQAVAGYDGLDPRQDRTVPLAVDALGGLTRGVDGLRIGVLEEGMDPAEPDVRDAVTAAVDVLVAAGATATRISVPEHRTAGIALNALEPEGARAIFDVGFFGAFARTYYPADYVAAVYELFHERGDRTIGPKWMVTLLASELARRRYRSAAYAKAQNARPAIRRAIDRALERVDVLVMPTCLEGARRYMASSGALDASAFAFSADIRNMRPYNFTGHPALSVPCGRTGRLPIGMQLVGRYYDDPLLLRAAHAFEASVDWSELNSTAARPSKVKVGA